MAWNLDDERRRRRHIRGRLVMVTAFYTSAAKRNRFAVCVMYLSADRWRVARDRWKRRNAVASLPLRASCPSASETPRRGQRLFGFQLGNFQRQLSWHATDS